MNKKILLITYVVSLYCFSISIIAGQKERDKRLKAIIWAHDKKYIIPSYIGNRDAQKSIDIYNSEIEETEYYQNLFKSQILSLSKHTNTSTKTGRNPLIVACKANNKDVVKKLLNRFADPNVYDHHGNTPLHIACKNNNVEIARLLINAYHVNINAKNYRKQTPLQIACKNNSIKIVELLCKTKDIDIFVLQAEPKEQPKKDSKIGTNILHIAAMYNFVDLIPHILRKLRTTNADIYKKFVNQKNQFGATPLNLACIQKHIECAQKLLANPYVCPNKKTSDGSTPLHSAVENGCLEIINLLINTQGINLCLQDNKPICKKFIMLKKRNGKKDKKIIIDSVNLAPNHNTPLHIACLTNNLDAIRLLVSPDRVLTMRAIKNANGLTPLQIAQDIAKETGNKEMLSLLQLL